MPKAKSYLEMHLHVSRMLAQSSSITREEAEAKLENSDQAYLIRFASNSPDDEPHYVITYKDVDDQGDPKICHVKFHYDGDKKNYYAVDLRTDEKEHQALETMINSIELNNQNTMTQDPSTGGDTFSPDTNTFSADTFDADAFDSDTYAPSDISSIHSTDSHEPNQFDTMAAPVKPNPAYDSVPPLDNPADQALEKQQQQQLQQQQQKARSEIHQVKAMSFNELRRHLSPYADDRNDFYNTDLYKLLEQAERKAKDYPASANKIKEAARELVVNLHELNIRGAATPLIRSYAKAINRCDAATRKQLPPITEIKTLNHDLYTQGLALSQDMISTSKAANISKVSSLAKCLGSYNQMSKKPSTLSYINFMRSTADCEKKCKKSSSTWKKIGAALTVAVAAVAVVATLNIVGVIGLAATAAIIGGAAAATALGVYVAADASPSTPTSAAEKTQRRTEWNSDHKNLTGLCKKGLAAMGAVLNHPEKKNTAKQQTTADKTASEPDPDDNGPQFNRP